MVTSHYFIRLNAFRFAKFLSLFWLKTGSVESMCRPFSNDNSAIEENKEDGDNLSTLNIKS